MTSWTQEKPNMARILYDAPASKTGSYAQWNNDWKRDTGQASGPPRCLIGVVLMLAAASVLEQRRKRERRQIE